MRLATTGILKQTALAVTASMGYLSMGLVRGYSSTAVPSLFSEDPQMVPSEQIASWISAIPPLGALSGSLLAGPLLEYLGRKGTLLISGPLFVIAWCSIAFSGNWVMLIAARAFTGFCVGISFPSAQVYVTECAQNGVRGLMGSLTALFAASGILVSYLLGSFVKWDGLALISALFPALMFFVLIPLPESPVWLKSQGKEKKSEDALAWLQISTLETPPETRREHHPTFRSFFHSGVLIPFFIVSSICFFQQMSGIDTVIFYTVAIFHSSGSSIDDYHATILVGAVQLVATLVSVFLVDRFGRRPLLLLSGTTMSVSMGVLGFYFYLYKMNEASSLGLVPLFSQLLFITGYSIGFSNIPNLLMGELLPEQQRSFLSSAAGAITLGTAFLSIKTFPDLRSFLGMEGVFWLYSFFCFFSCIFVYLFLPETKGKSLAEIEKYFVDKEKALERTQTAAEITIK